MRGILDNGLRHVRSDRSVAVTSAALERVVRSRGLSIVAKVDHARAAAEVGFNMRPTQLLIFGNPALGTPLMLAAPASAIDLPLKILVWEDAGGYVRLTYNDAGFLQYRHGFSEQLIENIDGVGSICEEAVRFQDSRTISAQCLY